ncbi:averantin oxidoreductase [Microthyrium microscopicum]|uniref:Averantin oxidoreductase n=1 Tax=Microthyrium microscopicum TaxID=703497 RepID=A0A6A6U3V3_9PEZI|nr:averantin oxidoreductase [Microthyrium microscopicum]
MDTTQTRDLGDRLKIAATALFGVFTLYYTGVVIYNRFFHPLAKFPGPFLNSVSDLPGIVWVLQGRLPFKTHRLHEKYGPVVRLSPNELAFNSHEAFTDIYGHKIGRKDLPKDPIHVGAVDPMPGVSTISMADHDTHARQRKALSHGFSKKALWSQESIVQGFVDNLMDIFKGYEKSGEAFDIVKWLNLITFDVIGDLSFGESFGCLENGDYHFWIHLIFLAVKVGAIEQATRRFANPGSTTQKLLMKLIPSELRKQRKNHLDYSRTKVMKRINDTKTDRKDFIYYILKQADHYDLSQDEVIVNAALFIVAGSETTASSLSSFTNMMLRNPAVFAKLKHEIRTAFPSAKDINLASATELPYLNACIEENLRVFPPAPIGFLRTIQASGDVIDGMHIPGGTAVSVSTWCAAHASANFRKPDEFIPERWLDKGYETDKFAASRPFSLGPRGCIGKDLSYLEMRLVLCHLVWNFDIENADAAENWNPAGDYSHIKAYSTWQKPQLFVKLTKAKHVDA